MKAARTLRGVLTWVAVVAILLELVIVLSLLAMPRESLALIDYAPAKALVALLGLALSFIAATLVISVLLLPHPLKLVLLLARGIFAMGVTVTIVPFGLLGISGTVRAEPTSWVADLDFRYAAPTSGIAFLVMCGSLAYLAHLYYKVAADARDKGEFTRPEWVW